MVIKLQRFLGTGMYSVTEAALYAKIKPAMMRRWLFGDRSGTKSILPPQYGTQDRVVSFLDLIQTVAIREIRIQKKVPLQKFRQAINLARKNDIVYPFAREHCTFLHVVEKKLVLKIGDKYIEASGKHCGQSLFEFVEDYLKDLTFGPDGLASEYTIFKDNRSGVPIVMNPQRRFGEPLLPSGYTAKTVWESIQIEGGIDQTASVYGISKDEVLSAHRFFVNLGSAA